MNIFGLGLPELLLILLVLLLFFGKDKLPELAKSIGKSFKELKSGFGEGTVNTSNSPEVKNKETVNTDSKEEKS
jgi:sec-independent protein translocase protein TatA